jgi:hypothetical protein
MLYLSLSPTIRDVSNRPSLKPLLNKPLTTKRNANIFYCEGAEYSFIPNSLRENDSAPCEKKYEAPAGTPITVKKFKTYKNPVSGFTHLFALAEVQLRTGKVEVEYNCGSTDLSKISNNLELLPLTIWQDDHEPRIPFR